MVSVERRQNCCCNDIPNFRKEFAQTQLSHHICISLFQLYLFPLSFIFFCIFHHVKTFGTFWPLPFSPSTLPFISFKASPYLSGFFSFCKIFSSISAFFLAFYRTQAGHDLWLLEDGLAGELLQHCDDHQTGGGGKSEYSIPIAPSVAPSPCI